MVDGVYCRILGPLAVAYSGENIRLGGYRQQTLLTMLLLEANQTVPIDRLVDAIWGENPPASARGQVRICVSDLRRRFSAQGLAEVIETHPVGYRIVVARDELDYYRFEDYRSRGRAAAAGGRPAEAAALLRSGLDLWAGTVTAGLDSELVRACAVKLNEHRIAALEDFFDIELSLGHEREIVSELTENIAEHPFREKLCTQLMVALYRAGRRADALDFFRATRRRFRDELGIEPGSRLCRLERMILTNDPELCEPYPLPDGPAAPRPPAAPTEDRLNRLERENARLRAEHDSLKRMVEVLLRDAVADPGLLEQSVLDTPVPEPRSRELTDEQLWLGAACATALGRG
jgi:DNA-binding SARP family transcriptional activator